MDTRKLDSWADLLLDTGKRNQLIHFRDTRFSTVEIFLPSAEELFDRIDGAASFAIFHPGLEVSFSKLNTAKISRLFAAF